MKKKIIVLTITFLLLLIVLAPAKLAENLIPKDIGVSVSGINGSLWSGNIASVSSKEIDLKDVNYSLSWLSLLMFSPAMTLDIGQGILQGELQVNLNDDMANQIEVYDADLRFDASLLELIQPLSGMALSGDITTQSLDLKTEKQKPVLLQGDIRWQQAALNFNGDDYVLGDFSVKAETNPDNGTITILFGKSDNKLGLRGTVTLTADGTVEIIGSIATDIDTRIYTTLALFNNGKPNEGRLPIKFKQKLFR